MDVWDYFEDRRAELTGYAADELSFEALPGDEEGRLHGDLTLADNAYLKVFQWAEVRAGRLDVVEYAYWLIVDGAEVRGWDKDPKKHPDQPVHGHVRRGPDRELQRVPADEVSLVKVLDLAWDFYDWWSEQDFGG